MELNERQDELSIIYSSQSQSLEINWKHTMLEIEIYNLLGICTHRLLCKRNHIHIDLKDLRPDTYLVFVRDLESNNYLAQKIIL
jgi:hypothetical protein